MPGKNYNHNQTNNSQITHLILQMLPFVVRAEANAKNYRTAAQETVAAREAQVAAVKQQKVAEKQAKLHIEKAESIRELKRERNAAEARRLQLERERDESLDILQAERDR